MLLVGLLEEHPRLPQIIEAMNGCADLFTCEAASTFVLVLSINPPRAAAVSRKSPWLTVHSFTNWSLTSTGRYCF